MNDAEESSSLQPLQRVQPEEHAPPAVYSYHDATAPLQRRGPGFSLRTRATVLLIAAGLLVGGGATFGALKLTGTTSSGVHVLYDATPVQAGTNNVVAVAQQLGPAVATVIARQPGSSTSASLGSGFVFAHDSSTSYLLTNNHVVTGSHDLHVLMPNANAYTATLVGADSLDDLAVVSVPDGSLPMATFGDSSQLKAGQTVIAIGSPLGNQGSVTSGVVSALHRTISAGGDTGTASETLQDVLQTDAPINPGNSGGPLADVEGRVVGVNVAIAGNANNIGYSIPSNLARVVGADLVMHQKVGHPFLGITYRDAIAAIEAGQGFNGPGVLVTTVRGGTPASQAGFQTGDILVAVDGVTIDNGQTLGGLIQSKKVGQQVTFTVRRGGQTLSLKATLVERPAN
jgi:putative serine protease PepD